MDFENSNKEYNDDDINYFEQELVSLRETI